MYLLPSTDRVQLALAVQLALLVREDLREIKVKTDHKVPLELLEIRETEDSLDHLDPPEHPAPLVPLETPEHPVCLERLAHR